MQSREKKISHNLMPLLSGALVLIPLLLAAGCTGQAPEPRLVGTGWTLAWYVHNGTPTQAVSGSTVTLDFGDDGRITGSAGCNRYFASYEMKGTAISIGQAGSTMMYCSTPGVMEQESAYLTLLSQAKTITIDGDRLTLSDAKGTTLLAFVKTVLPAPEPLVGTNWTLESLHTADAVSSGIAGTTITTIFGEDGRLAGSAGCNRYFAQYTMTGTLISISSAGSTKMFCATPRVMQQESTYLALLSQATTFTIDGDRLTLSGAKDATLLTFAKTDLPV